MKLTLTGKSLQNFTPKTPAWLKIPSIAQFIVILEVELRYCKFNIIDDKVKIVVPIYSFSMSNDKRFDHIQ